MATIQELRNETYKVIHETQEGGNSSSRIGNLYNGIIDFLDVLNDRTIDPYYYDDSAIKEAIRRVNAAIEELDRALEAALALANQERQRLDDLVNTIDGEINEKVEDMLNDAQWLEEHARGIQELVNEGEIYWKSEWNQNIGEYLQEAGVWARDGDIIKAQWTSITQSVGEISSTVAEVQQDLAGRPTSTQWSQITQKVNGIEQTVNKLLYQPGSLEALQSSITQSIDDKVARLNLETTYAKAEDFGDSTKVIEWLYSALRNETTPEKTFNDIVSASKSGLLNGISNIHTYVEVVRKGEVLDYVAGAAIEAKVNDAVTGLYSKATTEEASTSIFSQVKKDSQNIAAILVGTVLLESEITNSYAAMVTRLDGAVALLATKAELGRATSTLQASIDNNTSAVYLQSTLEGSVGKLITANNISGYTSGFATTSDLNSATANMVAKSDYNAASITAMVNNSGSEIRLNANKINFTFTQATNFVSGNKTVMSLDGQGNLSITGEVTATSGKIGGFSINGNNLIGDSNAYIRAWVDGYQYAILGDSDAELSVRNDRGKGVYIYTQGSNSVGLQIDTGAGSGKAIEVKRGNASFGGNVSISGDVSISGNLIAGGSIKTGSGSYSLPTNPTNGQIVFVKGTSGGFTVRGSYSNMIMHADSHDTSVALDMGVNSTMFVCMSGYWVQFYCG